MTTYFVVMMIIVALGIAAPQQFQWPLRVAVFIGLLIFCGARIEVGPDWYSYIIYQNYLVSSLTELTLLSEPSFTVVSIVSEELGWGIIGVNLVAAFIFLFGLFALVAKTPYPWCAIAVAFCYYIPALPMGIIRQAAAVGITFILVVYWGRTALWQRFALVAFAMTFHISAVVMLGVVFAALNIDRWKRAVMAVAVIILTAALGIDPLSYFAVYNDRYIGGIGGVVVETTAATFHWLLIALPAAWYLYMRNELTNLTINSELLFVSSVMAISLVAILPISSAAVTRLAMYFSYLPILIGGTIAYTYPRYRALMRGGVLIGSIIVLTVWLTFAENSAPYKPYKNYLTESVTTRKMYSN